MKPRKPQRVLMNQGQIWQNVGSLRLCGSPTSWEMLDEERADDPALFLILADETMLGRVIVAQHSPIRAPPAAEVAQPNTERPCIFQYHKRWRILRYIVRDCYIAWSSHSEISGLNLHLYLYLSHHSEF